MTTIGDDMALTPGEHRALLRGLALRFADIVGSPSTAVEAVLQRAVEAVRDQQQREPASFVPYTVERTWPYIRHTFEDFTDGHVRVYAIDTPADEASIERRRRLFAPIPSPYLAGVSHGRTSHAGASYRHVVVGPRGTVVGRRSGSPAGAE